MRVLIVSRGSYALPAAQGGTDAYSLRTALFLVPRGHEVYLVGQGRPGPAFGQVRFVQVPTDKQITSRFRAAYFVKGLLLSLASVLTAIKTLNRHRSSIDLIHSNSNLGAIALKALFPEKPLVYTLHDPLVEPSKSRSMLEQGVRLLNNGLLERWALQRADHVVCVSGELLTQVERTFGPSEKLTLLYPIHSLPSSGTRPTHWGSDLESRLGPYILSVGAQTGRKRFDLLIRSLALNGPELNLVLVGTGPDRPHLVRTATESGLSSRVIFYDRVSDERLSRLYRGALAYVIVSEREGFPTTLVEAALCGTPCLYFTDSATPDLDGDQSDFFRVVHSLSEAHIAEAIHGICSHADLVQLNRRQIAEWAKSRFPSGDAVAHELSEIYDLVAGSNDTAAPT
jgi:glycosyltransferase involved in cell wall biosynthesis